MLSDEDRVRLNHMLEASEKAFQFAEGRSRTDLDTDEKLSLSLVRLLEIVGEAARAVSQGTRDELPSIPWKAIAGTRDRLIHGYFNVDLDVVWAIINEDLPALTRDLRELLNPRMNADGIG